MPTDQMLRDHFSGLSDMLDTIADRLVSSGSGEPDLHAAVSFIRAAATLRARVPAGPVPDALHEQSEILYGAAEKLEQAVDQLDDPEAISRIVEEIEALARRGDDVYASALAGSRRWRSVHGRIEWSVDRCGHAGRALERLVLEARFEGDADGVRVGGPAVEIHAGAHDGA